MSDQPTYDSIDQLLDDAAKDLSPADLLELYKHIADKFAAHANFGKPVG